MINSIHNVDQNFYGVFLGAGFASNTLSLVTHKAKTVIIPIIYARASAYDRAEMTTSAVGNYPMISILNYSPEIHVEWADLFWKNYFAGLDVVTDVNGVEDTIYEFAHGIPLNFKYEINFAAKSESEFTAIKDYFFKTFTIKKQSSLMFNRIDVSLDDVLNRDTAIGDPVYYKMVMTDIPRTDGVFQGMTTFTIQAWVDSKDPVAHDLITQIALNFQLKTI